MQITVNGSKINGTVSNIRSKTANIDNLIKQLEGLIEEIPVYWSGTDADKFINLMKSSCTTKLRNMNETIKEYTNYLENVPNVYELLDESFSSRDINV